MKFGLAVLALFAALNVYSQTTPGSDAMESQMNRFIRERPDQDLFVLREEKPNEIKRSNVTYSGIFVELSKTDNPLQLINPAAPPEYGSTEDNTVRDPISGEVSGLKLLSIQF
jgi:hypothetical protein